MTNDEVVATDVATRALDLARARLDADGVLGRVELHQASLLDPWPPGRFDLIVLSEVLYYLDDNGLATTIARAVAALEAEGMLIGVHWRHPVPEYPPSGGVVQDAIATGTGPSRSQPIAMQTFASTCTRGDQRRLSRRRKGLSDPLQGRADFEEDRSFREPGFG
ncbi:class I SAM-dependent methyltransferase [Rhodococcus sp. NPDC057529]|uniref:class I SAM-dependent methyltransferase n=1 Tax=Rhodococcus sp. NPDC057529 TaxID=3346158 RepID=UPI00366F2D07